MTLKKINTMDNKYGFFFQKKNEFQSEETKGDVMCAFFLYFSVWFAQLYRFVWTMQGQTKKKVHEGGYVDINFHEEDEQGKQGSKCVWVKDLGGERTGGLTFIF